MPKPYPVKPLSLKQDRREGDRGYVHSQKLPSTFEHKLNVQRCITCRLDERLDDNALVEILPQP